MATDHATDPGGAPSSVEVLLVEDNPGDARLVEEAFDALDRPVRLTVVGDGAAALDRLLGTDAARPALVLLDLDLPGTDGLTVLRELKSEPAARRIPIVVFTTSGDPADVRESYEHHANAYVTKPRDADQFFGVVRRLDAFWFSAATIPGGGTP